MTGNHRWFSRGLLAVLVVCGGIFALLALPFGKRLPFAIGLCDRHKRQRKLGTYAAFATPIAGLALLMLTVPSNSDLCAILGMMLLFATPIVAIVGRRVLWLIDMDAGFLHYRGAHPDYLATLPNWPGTPSMLAALAEMPGAGSQS